MLSIELPIVLLIGLLPIVLPIAPPGHVILCHHIQPTQACTWRCASGRPGSRVCK